MTDERGPAAGSEDRFRRILETAPDAMVGVGADGCIDFINAQTEALFGYARRDLLGQPLDMLIPERFRPNHAVHMAHFLRNPGARPMGTALELFGRRADGSEMAIDVSLSTVRSGDDVSVSAAIRDITQRKRLEAEAKLAADRLASAVESIQDAFALFDANDRLALCNSAYRTLTGDAMPGPLVGKAFEELLTSWLPALSFASDVDRERFRKERLLERADPRAPFDVLTREGRSLRVANRRTVEGGVVQTIWDLTDDVRREEELRATRAAAESASAAKSEFLSSMSHELRTPLNAILGFAQLLVREKKEPLSSRNRERIQQILNGGEHLLRLIDDVLDLSRIEAGGVSVSIEPIDFIDVLAEATSTLTPIAARAGIQVEAASVPATLPLLSADRTRFVQILMNYGSNAIKYSRPGGRVVFAVSTVDGERVRVAVTDTGLGIPAEKQDKLFRPFERAGQETGAIEGTGIGLVITKRLAELMGGGVGFSSREGVGSTFWVDIPAHVTSTPAMPRAAREIDHPIRLALAGQRRVLYVEDNPANVLFMRDLLGDFDNLELITVPTGELGIELARELPPDVIIMDINLPGISGLDALRALRELPETRHVPIIGLTAAASEHDRQRGEQAGFYRYLTKPVKIDELEAALEALLVPKS